MTSSQIDCDSCRYGEVIGNFLNIHQSHIFEVILNCKCIKFESIPTFIMEN